MANIATSIQIHDKVSAPINNMIGAITKLTSAFDSVDDSMGGAFDSKLISQARNQIQQAEAQMRKFGEETEDSRKKQDRLNDEIEEGTNAMDGLVGSVMGLAGAYLSLQGITDFISGAMEGSNLESGIVAQLKTVLKNVGAAKGAFEELQEEA